MGKSLTMSLAHDKTGTLWQSFMPRRNEITNRLSADLYSLQVYDASYFVEFNPASVFEKWALMEVSDFERIPDEMSAFSLPGGLYAVFYYKGPSTDTGIFEYIFRTWLPDSKYTLDSRPHFTVMGEKYKNEDPDSEEDIWIPIKPKE